MKAAVPMITALALALASAMLPGDARADTPAVPAPYSVAVGPGGEFRFVMLVGSCIPTAMTIGDGVDSQHLARAFDDDPRFDETRFQVCREATLRSPRRGDFAARGTAKGPSRVLAWQTARARGSRA